MSAEEEAGAYGGQVDPYLDEFEGGALHRGFEGWGGGEGVSRGTGSSCVLGQFCHGVMFHVGTVISESVFAGLREFSCECEAGCLRHAGGCGRGPPRAQPGQ